MVSRFIACDQDEGYNKIKQWNGFGGKVDQSASHALFLAAPKSKKGEVPRTAAFTPTFHRRRHKGARAQGHGGFGAEGRS